MKNKKVRYFTLRNWEPKVYVFVGHNPGYAVMRHGRGIMAWKLAEMTGDRRETTRKQALRIVGAKQRHLIP